MVARINELGVPLEVESVFAMANCKSPGRPHVARAMVKAGLISNLDEAFERTILFDDDFDLQAGYSICASTQVAETFKVHVEGTDWNYAS